MDDHGGEVNKMVGWIPVEERLPENGTYLCTLDGELCGIDEPFAGMCGIENGRWDEEGCVIAWMPLPEPYKEKIGLKEGEEMTEKQRNMIEGMNLLLSKLNKYGDSTLLEVREIIRISNEVCEEIKEKRT